MNKLNIGILVFSFSCLYGGTNALYDGFLGKRLFERRSSIEGIDCVYLINLKRRPDRLKRVDRILRKHGVDYTLVKAIDGNKLFPMHSRQAIKIQSVKNPRNAKLRPGEIGCFLSHYLVFKDAYNKGYKTIWVLEDDIEVCGKISDIPPMLKALNKDLPKWDMFFPYNRTSKSWSRHKGKPFNDMFEIRSNLMYGTFSMIVSKRGIKKIFTALSNKWMSLPIDMFIAHVANPLSVMPRKKSILYHREINGIADFDSDIR